MPEKYNLPLLYHQNNRRFITIAHRGASAYFPENTIIAFKGAIAMKAPMIELDVMLSKDKVPVVFHDAALDVHTNGRGLVSSFLLKELKKLDAGSWFGPEFSGELIPTLAEVLAFTAGKVALNIEIKTEAVTDELRGGIEEKCLELVKEYEMQNHVLFSSFDYRAIVHLKKLSPAMPVALLYEKSQSDKKMPHELVRQYKADAFNCSYRQFTKKRMADLKKYQIPTFVYTVDKESRMRKLLDAGVTGIFTNKPDLLNRLIKRY